MLRLETSASLKDAQRSYTLGTCVFLDFTVIQCNAAQVFLGCYLEAVDDTPQILKKTAAARGWQL